MNIEKKIRLGIQEAPKFTKLAGKLLSDTAPNEPVVVMGIAVALAIGSSTTRTKYLVQGFAIGVGSYILSDYIKNRFRKEVK